LTRKNLAAFTKALGMFTPFVGPLPAPVDPAAPNARAERADLDELKTQLSEMQRRLDSLVDKR
jgi:polyhydroxyalkanoate synthesis regulator protein